MSAAPSHARLDARWTFSGHLVGTTALHVGTGSETSGLSPSDLPIARDGRGRPYVPGSSFRGALRAGLESLLRGLDHEVCDPFDRTEGSPTLSCGERTHRRRKDLQDLNESFGEQRAFELAWEESCPICQLFGHLFLASRVWIGDLRLVESSDGASYVRDGVGLDRDLRSAAKGILYNFEALPPGARFELALEVDNPRDWEVGLLLAGLDLVGDGYIRVGGKSARGLGRAEVEGLVLQRRTARSFLDGSGAEKVGPQERDRLLQQARQHFIQSQAPDGGTPAAAEGGA